MLVGSFSSLLATNKCHLVIHIAYKLSIGFFSFPSPLKLCLRGCIPVLFRLYSKYIVRQIEHEGRTGQDETQQSFCYKCPGYLAIHNSSSLKAYSKKYSNLITAWRLEMRYNKGTDAVAMFASNPGTVHWISNGISDVP